MAKLLVFKKALTLWPSPRTAKSEWAYAACWAGRVTVLGKVKRRSRAMAGGVEAVGRFLQRAKASRGRGHNARAEVEHIHADGGARQIAVFLRRVGVADDQASRPRSLLVILRPVTRAVSSL